MKIDQKEWQQFISHSIVRMLFRPGLRHFILIKQLPVTKLFKQQRFTHIAQGKQSLQVLVGSNF